MTTAKRICLPFVTALCFCSLSSGQAAADAFCSKNEITAGANVSFTCSGLTPDQAKTLEAVPGLLTRLLRSEKSDVDKIINGMSQLSGKVKGMQMLLKNVSDAVKQMEDRQGKSQAPTLTDICPGGVCGGSTVIQSASSPCTGNSVGGNVDNTNCNPPANPYKPVATYDPNGLQRMSVGTKFVIDQSAELEFREMAKEEAAQNWPALLVAAARAKEKYPGWFTTDFASGEAHFNLCESAAALADPRKFTKRGAGCP